MLLKCIILLENHYFNIQKVCILVLAKKSLYFLPPSRLFAYLDFRVFFKPYTTSTGESLRKLITQLMRTESALGPNAIKFIRRSSLQNLLIISDLAYPGN